MSVINCTSLSETFKSTSGGSAVAPAQSKPSTNNLPASFELTSVNGYSSTSSSPPTTTATVTTAQMLSGGGNGAPTASSEEDSSSAAADNNSLVVEFIRQQLKENVKDRLFMLNIEKAMSDFISDQT